jgi:CDP-6-deoxy-D-xylo-4-hexulose-3-dehydrase
MPYAIEGAEPSWFGFAMGCERRNDLAIFLDEHKIGNRPLFAGNLLRQPAYKNVDCRIVGGLRNADYVHDNVLWVGCWPGLTRDMLDYIVQVIHEFYR